MRKVVYASMNKNKAEEIQRIAPNDMQIICLKDIPDAYDIPRAKESGENALENARIKAKYWYETLNMPVIAEKSSLEIEALNGKPGVNFKKCMESICPGLNINVNNPKELYPLLLELMRKSRKESKKALWTLAMAYVDETTTICAVKSLAGSMTPCAGKREFGFDQYFRPEGMEKTLSELTLEEKNEISPRKIAFEAFRSHI